MEICAVMWSRPANGGFIFCNFEYFIFIHDNLLYVHLYIFKAAYIYAFRLSNVQNAGPSGRAV